jgi:hypothetical protein
MKRDAPTPTNDRPSPLLMVLNWGDIPDDRTNVPVSERQTAPIVQPRRTRLRKNTRKHRQTAASGGS